MRSNLLPFNVPFLAEKVPFHILSIDKWYPFHITSLELCILLAAINPLRL